MKRTVKMSKQNPPSIKSRTAEGSKFKGFKYGGGNRPKVTTEQVISDAIHAVVEEVGTEAFVHAVLDR